MRGSKPTDPQLRFDRQTMYAGDCIVWTGRLNYGYGDFMISYINGRIRKTKAHRYAYEQANGPIPEGLVINHLCHNRACVNPAHLVATTHRENLFHANSLAPAKINKAKTHCKRGHEFIPDNIRVVRNQRWCRECVRLRGSIHDKKRRHGII